VSVGGFHAGRKVVRVLGSDVGAMCGVWWCADYSFMRHEQALVAAAGVAAARSMCKISPVWPDELAKRLGYSREDLSECLESILAVAKLDPKPSETKAAPSSAACSEASNAQEALGEAGQGATNGAETGSVEAGSSKGEGKEEGSPRCATAFVATW
jgi:hypothetical protein